MVSLKNNCGNICRKIAKVLSLCRQTITNYKAMKKYKVKEVIELLEKEGWYLLNKKGSHRQFKHLTKKGKTTVNGKPSDTLDQELLNSIWKQAGWR